MKMVKAYVKSHFTCRLKNQRWFIIGSNSLSKAKTESISRSVPIVLGGLDLQFLPEGGALLEGATCQLSLQST